MTPQPQQHQLPAVAAAVVYPHQGRRVTGDVGRKPPPPPPAPAMGDKSKKQWEHVPAVLTDRGKTYIIRDILGEGGFARCYRAIPEDGSKPDFAVKVVPKTSLKNLKTRNKLLSEIKIHQVMKHPYIVNFISCFEDKFNVYMLLELCPNSTLMELVKKRRRLTAAEVRFFFLQILQACLYMHSNLVIHRDLKLGNIFLGEGMTVKIGDFGLAAMLEEDGERKKTICGTPNYIAPEILFGKDAGHSFEVDAWSMGVILYTMLVGKPPFQTKDVKEIYKRIRDIASEFPSDIPVPDSAKNLIQALLCKDPEKRLRIDEIDRHPFFSDGPIPQALTTDIFTFPPQEYRDERKAPVANAVVPPIEMKRAHTEEPISSRLPELPAAIAVKRVNADAVYTDNPSSSAAAREVKMKRTHSEVATAEAKENLSPPAPLSNQLELNRSPAIRVTAIDVVKPKPVETEEDDDDDEEEDGAGEEAPSDDTESMLPPPNPEAEQNVAVTVAPEIRSMLPGRDSLIFMEETLRTLALAFDFKAKYPKKPLSGREFEPTTRPVKNPVLFIAKWMDYTNRYGLGYELTDGSTAVYFNDTSSMVIAPDSRYLDYLHYPDHQPGKLKEVITRDRYTMQRYPTDLRKKTTLLGHFREYMRENLYQPYQFKVGGDMQSEVVFLSRWCRCKKGVVFRMSHGVIQINFFDHYKLLLTDQGKVVSLIDVRRKMRTWEISKAVEEKEDVIVEGRRVQREAMVVEKLKYARTALLFMLGQQSSSSTSGANAVTAMNKE